MLKILMLASLAAGVWLASTPLLRAAQNGKNNKTNAQKNDERRENDAVQKAQKDVNAAEKVMRDIVAKNGPRTQAKIDFVHRYPPMPPLPKNEEVLRVFDAVSRDLGQGPIVATDALMRGAGDSAFASPYAAVLDGLGPVGKGSHAANETVELKTLPTQVARAAVLIYRLTR